ncbi:T6SS immunity protein Tli4 family protein [Acinetobacter baumannii]|uniref:T6SS immunity protein Tli4 family protein n=1 Tax=Acinetobacter baumannii TaxID=470 RepID=UPI002152B031|nr:T6SS immunity protein Tli4 family protein [Acinetobacter baumannii]MCR6568532.1 T6SS immunity protein Tli4 family protein [Acinetobacter baumannii]MDC5070896.1 T6SS immunity protein Tli4 family protein [Acinetobacter baumannii]MDV4322424.1 T6SS immunity protein Tli4 family protein [Acinetobacter baumannii]MDV4337045.1 T6SS immunity protein Tli4 family protein [Acinetobacter baumannii]
MNLLKRLTLCLLTTVSFSACSNVEKEQEGIKVIDYSNPKKVCFGRIELTVPKETQVEYSNFNYNGSNIEVDESVKTYEAYQKLINDKIQYLKHEPHETEGVLLKREMQGPVNQAGRSVSHIIVFRDGQYVTSIYEVYGYLYLSPGRLLVLKSGASNDLLDNAIEDMKHTLKSIKIRSTKGEEQAGLCWKEFFILDDMSKNIPFGGGYLHFKFPSYPQVRADVAHRVTYDSDLHLIELMKKNQQELPAIAKTLMSIENLREHKKIINGLAGEEVLNHMSRRGHFERGYEIGEWQYLGTLDNHNDPYIQFSFDSADMVRPDDPLNSTISQKEALRLNDFILNSIQITPNNKKEK